MAQRYFISGEVADGDFYINDMSADFTDAELSYIVFYSDEFSTVVTPSSGTVTYTQSADGINYREMPEGVFSAASAYDASRVPPNGSGLAVSGKLTLSSVVGATHFTACVWRS